MAGVTETNMRPFSTQLEFVMPVLPNLQAKLEGVERTVVLADDGETVPENTLGDLLDYETLMSEEPETCVFPEVDERAPAAMCYASGTAGNPITRSRICRGTGA